MGEWEHIMYKLNNKLHYFIGQLTFHLV